MSEDADVPEDAARPDSEAGEVEIVFDGTLTVSNPLQKPQPKTSPGAGSAAQSP